MDTFPAFLKTALDALPDAAKSPLALIAYLGVIGAWSAIAWRVKRNKQLLKHLDKLPERDRLNALQLEMGTIPLPRGLSPDQWLKARIQRYYFLGFAIVCIVAVIIFAIASFKAKSSDPLLPLKQGVEFLDIGVTRDAVISKLGVARSETHFKASTCAEYRFDFAYVQLLYDKLDQIVYYLVVSLDKNYRPILPLQYTLKKEACLGCLTFSEIIPPDERPEPAYFNFSSKLYTYTEWLPSYGLASNGKAMQISLLGAGFDFGSDTTTPAEVLTAMTKSPSAYEKAAPEAKSAFLNFRANTKPNAFAVYSERLELHLGAMGSRLGIDFPRDAGETDCQGNLAYHSYLRPDQK